VLSALPIINIANCCCLWIVGGGALAAYLAQQEDPSAMTAGCGATVGLLAGVAGAFVWLIVALAVDTVMAPFQQRMVAEVIRNAPDMPPEVREWLEMMGDRTAAPLRFAVGFVFQLLAGTVFATLGGVLAAMFFGRRTTGPSGLIGPQSQQASEREPRAATTERPGSDSEETRH
jgi:hypothetical protein